MSRIINSVHVKSFPIIIDSVHVKSFPVKSHPPNSCAFVFRQNFREGRQKRTAYFAPVGPSTPVLVPGIQWGDYSNSGIHLRYVTTVFKIRASQGWCYTRGGSCRLLLKIRPQWSEILKRCLFRLVFVFLSEIPPSVRLVQSKKRHKHQTGNRRLF